MKYTITGRHVSLTKGIKDYAKKRFKKLEDYFDFRQKGELDIIIDVQKYRHMAEANLFSKRHKFTAKSETKDMYSSIDMLETKLVNQVKKHKDKIVKGEKTRGRKLNILANISSGDSVRSEKYNEIIEEELQALKPINTEEALEEVRMSRQDIMLFYNIDFNKVCLLRKRKDGKYGLTISKF